MSKIKLTRTSHRLSTAPLHLLATTALCSFSVLDVVHDYVCGHFNRMPCRDNHLQRLATKVGEKSRLSCTLFFLITSLVAPTPSQASQDPSNVILVTATHRGIEENHFTKSVSVITEEAMEKSKVNTLAEALRNVPGITLRNQGGLGRNTNVQIRGGLTRQTLVLFDGVLGINSPTVGVADLGSFFNTGIEQIEVIRSASGVIHSSRAQSGLINIITKRGKGPLESEARSEFGTNRTFRETVALSGSEIDAFGGLAQEAYYAFSATRVDSDGIGDENAFENSYFTTRLGLDLNDAWNFDFVSRLYKSSVGLDTTTFPGFEPLGEKNSVQNDTFFSVKPEVNLNLDYLTSTLAFSGTFQDQYFRGYRLCQ